MARSTYTPLTEADFDLAYPSSRKVYVEGGGGVHEGEGPSPQGMVKEVFVELCELLAPKWARKDM